MSSNADPFEYDHWSDAPPEQTPITLEHARVTHEDAPDELAIFPASTATDGTHEWVVASGTSSFVDLESVR